MKSKRFTATYRHPLIAREGWSTLALTALAAILLQSLVDVRLGALLWILWLLLLYLFRDPRRKVPAIPLALLSPADGHVVSIDWEQEKHSSERMRRIRLAMNPLGVYSLRSPIEGKVIRQWFPGTEDAEATYGQWVRSDEGDDVVVRITAGRLQRRPFCYAQSGERIGQGQRCGYVAFGTYLDVLVPGDSRLAVKEGEPVKSGVSVLGRLLRR